MPDAAAPATSEALPGQEALEQYVNERIRTLRPRLLDLSRRNPLLATRISPRSLTQVRVIDQPLTRIAVQLAGGKRLTFAPLPALELDPPDEDEPAFQQVLATARLTDEVYLAEVAAAEEREEEDPELQRQLERALRNRVRVALGLPSHEPGVEISLEAHARKHGIAPAHELPLEDAGWMPREGAAQHLQTLFLQPELTRKLTALLAKAEEFSQETGVTVLHAAFGFLEWREPGKPAIALAPLLLMPVELHKHSGRQGLEFRLTALADEPEPNLVLAEFLKQQFGLSLPAFEPGRIADYFAALHTALNDRPQWHLRQQVTVGIFPSARMVMYYDLDPDAFNFARNDNLRRLFGGSEEAGQSGFAPDYAVDDPAIESKVPLLVVDADSSQFSTLVDVADGRSVAVEGPPGTGKSQTIVNAIAGALAAGKKVLFVAEKMAALDVVKSRLEAIGLGDFVLALQAGSASRAAVIKHLKARLALAPEAPPAALFERVKAFRETRAQLAAYLAALAARFAQTGMSVHEILSRCIALAPVAEGLPETLRGAALPGLDTLSATTLEARCAAVAALADALREVAAQAKHWRGIGITRLNPFEADELRAQAAAAGEALQALARAEDALAVLGLAEGLDYAALASELPGWRVLRDLQPKLDLGLLGQIVESDAASALRAFMTRCGAAQLERAALARLVPALDAPDAPDALCKLAGLAARAGSAVPEFAGFTQRIAAEEAALAREAALVAGLTQLASELPAIAQLSLGDLAAAAALLREYDTRVLALRHAGLLEPVAQQAARGLLTSIRRQAERRAALQALFDLDDPIVPAALNEHAAALRAGGALAFLSPAWRRAKQAYLHGSRRSTFDLAVALTDLQQVGEWKAAEESLRADPRATNLFGPLFDGHRTDFLLLEQLLGFLATLDERLPGSAQRELRRFLQTGPLDALRSLLQLEWVTDCADLPALIRRLERRQEKLTEARAVLAELQSLRPLWQGAPAAPTVLEDTARRLSALRAEEQALAAEPTAARLLGAQFAGAATRTDALSAELTALAQLDAFAGAGAHWLEILQAGDAPRAVAAGEAVLAQHETAQRRLMALEARVARQASVCLAPGEASARAAALHAAAEDRDGLQANLAYAAQRQAVAADLPVCEQLLEAGIRPEALATAFRAVLLRALARAVYAEHGEQLTAYTGEQLDALRERLAGLDREIQLGARRALRGHLLSNAAPPRGRGLGPKSSWTEMALLVNETEKRKRWLPVRQLTARAGAALQALKPCWMMSPLAVAQYVRREGLQFDLCIIDEASQMPPEDAVGAIARSKQVMVVGDTNQLPPTSFFSRLLETDDESEDGAPVEESILEVANGAFRPARRLRWHYRSRHSALIQFCNREIYDNGLVVFPAAAEARPDMGVRLVPVNGYYQGSVNPIEAQVMVAHALAFMRQRPDRSLGIVTLNQKQRELIESELAAAIADDPPARRYVAHWEQQREGLEKFFIKNLENVQGDERDVIFIGTVYGPERPGGSVHARFGPINGQAGRRRLNVLLSRARDQLVTFSSMTPANFPAQDRLNPGAAMLRAWLEYAGSGRLHGGALSGRAPDSDFEDFVAEQIRALGFEPVPQVGVAGYFIDIGVRHPDWPYGFVLGVECDGASFHSAPSARDRDRLRGQVLAGLGWQLHRIWSTDWFGHPAREIARLKQTLDARLQALLTAPPAVIPALPADDVAPETGQLGLFGLSAVPLTEDAAVPDAEEDETLDAEGPAEDEADDVEDAAPDEEETGDDSASGPQSYAGLLPEVQKQLDQDSFYDAAYNRRLREFALAVIDEMGPVTEAHLCEIVARCHRFARTGRRIRDRVLKLVDRHRPYGEEGRQGGSYWPQGRTPVTVMDFRGLQLGTVSRQWKDLPLPERLGLARRALSVRSTRREQVEFMQRELRLARLSQPTARALDDTLQEMARRLAAGE